MVREWREWEIPLGWNFGGSVQKVEGRGRWVLSMVLGEQGAFVLPCFAVSKPTRGVKNEKGHQITAIADVQNKEEKEKWKLCLEILNIPKIRIISYFQGARESRKTVA